VITQGRADHFFVLLTSAAQRATYNALSTTAYRKENAFAPWKAWALEGMEWEFSEFMLTHHDEHPHVALVP
jgi:hypothetical protein